MDSQQVTWQLWSAEPGESIPGQPLFSAASPRLPKSQVPSQGVKSWAMGVGWGVSTSLAYGEALHSILSTTKTNTEFCQLRSSCSVSELLNLLSVPRTTEMKQNLGA